MFESISALPAAAPVVRGESNCLIHCLKYNVYDTSSVKNKTNIAPTSSKDIRYSRRGYSDYQIRENMEIVASMLPVIELTGNEFKKGKESLTSQVSRFFKSVSNVAVNPEFGEVRLLNTGIKSSIAHGLGRQKSIAYAAVPDIISKGKVINASENWKNRGYKSVVIAAPFIIAGEQYYGGAVVRILPDFSSYYLHEVVMEKENPLALKTGTSQTGTSSGQGIPSIKRLLNQVVNVKDNINATKDDSGQLYSRRITDDMGMPTPRGILAGAFGLVAKTDAEKQRVASYKKQVSLFDRIDGLLIDKQGELRDLKASGASAQQIQDVQAEISELTKKLDSADRILLNLQNSKPLKNIVTRERNKAYQVAKERADTRIAAYKERAYGTIDRRNKRERFIGKAKRLDQLLRNESDQKHIPEGFKGPVLGFLQPLTENTSVFDYKTLSRVKMAYDALAEGGKHADTDLAGMYDFDIAEDLQTLTDTMDGRRLSELSEGELDKLNDIADHFLHIVRNENQTLYSILDALVKLSDDPADVEEAHKKLRRHNMEK